MKDPVEDYLVRLPIPHAIDPHWVARIMHPHWPEYALQELEARVAEQAARDGYRCVYQGP